MGVENASKSISTSQCDDQLSNSKINTLVRLNVYDLTPVNNYVYWFGFGIFHSGIEGLSLFPLTFLTSFYVCTRSDLVYSFSISIFLSLYCFEKAPNSRFCDIMYVLFECLFATFLHKLREQRDEYNPELLNNV